MASALQGRSPTRPVPTIGFSSGSSFVPSDCPIASSKVINPSTLAGLTDWVKETALQGGTLAMGSHMLGGYAEVVAHIEIKYYPALREDQVQVSRAPELVAAEGAVRYSYKPVRFST